MSAPVDAEMFLRAREEARNWHAAYYAERQRAEAAEARVVALEEALTQIRKEANVLPFAPGFQTLIVIRDRAQSALDTGKREM